MKVIFTCGGTAGHVNPALALAGYMKKKDPTVEILFVGTPRGMERGLVAKAGYDYRGIEVGGFDRRLSLHSLRHNLKSAADLLILRRRADEILREFPADLVVGTGGYASYPMVKYAALRGIPTAVHEANMIPGLTTQMLEKHASRIMVGFEECRTLYKHPERIVVTGTPVRGDFFKMTKEEAKRQLGVDDGRPLIVSFWGSLGASGMNRQMADFLALEAAKEPFHHIHGAGASGYPMVRDLLREKGVDLEAHPALQLREYIYDMAPVMRAADLVICRAGASTISELTALGVPALIVPSPYVTNNHQEKNARVLESAGGAEVLLEKDCSGQAMFQAACGILHDTERRKQMETAMASLGIRDATERIYQTVLEICQEP